jgi:flagellar biosynthesis protein FlhF
VNAQRFTGKTVREAYASARAALGKDAMIIEQRQTDGLVELIAALESDPVVVKETAVLAPAHAARLSKLGFPETLIGALPTHLSGWEAVLRYVVRQVVVDSPPAALSGAWRFVGPPGSGKTSLLIKVLADAVLKGLRPESILVVATDQARLGGRETLALAAELLDVDLQVASRDTLPRLLLEQDQRRLVLIDSAGADVNQLTPIKAIRDVGVFPATWQLRGLERLHHLYRRLSAQAFALSFVDEADEPGGALSVLMGGATPLTWISTGDRLPDDLAGASHDWLLERLLGHVDRARFTTMFA